MPRDDNQDPKPKGWTKPKAGAKNTAAQNKNLGMYNNSPYQGFQTPTTNGFNAPATGRLQVARTMRVSDGTAPIVNTSNPSVLQAVAASNQSYQNAPITTPIFSPFIPRTVSPSDMVNDYTGMPVNDSYSDTLRSIQPEQLGSGDANQSYSDTLRSLAAGNYSSPAAIPWNMVAQPTSGGNGGYGGYSPFSSQYKGWGGGGGGGYGGGGDYNPWLNYMMGLNNWQI